MLVGRSLEINGNIYSRLMVEARFIGNRTRLTGLHFLFYKWVIKIILVARHKMISITYGKIINN
ncbi:hypothetical protein Phep_2518 [Pedobacter heparinus DSM 2366]|uniref:Uncharacterized protein n=1 Tax=Pedobacter heparinus (strain ATCC 13125 / DSM 2366 / CIP 104194 / JCM 7457 / NBRC 12017 / NCIMB 9290 / NRRL B-14731 / HIM 762-3) TaxID=485917 RepID=C6XZM6_PEDHD|nr:hypothetical protein Phep_2518 [Pedobacter heparinus DSM 2366]